MDIEQSESEALLLGEMPIVLSPEEYAWARELAGAEPAEASLLREALSKMPVWDV